MNHPKTKGIVTFYSQDNICSFTQRNTHSYGGKSYPQSKSCIFSSFYHISCVCRWIMWITLGITLFIVCVKHGETVGKYGFLCGNRKFCGFFIHILADFAVSFWAFPCFFLLFLVLPFYCFYFTGIYSSKK